MKLLRAVSFFHFLGVILGQDTWSSWLSQGIRAFDDGQYREANVTFQKSVDLNPSAVEPRRYLGKAWMDQYIPGAASPESFEAASNAERAFLAVLDLDPKNVTALGLTRVARLLAIYGHSIRGVEVQAAGDGARLAPESSQA